MVSYALLTHLRHSTDVYRCVYVGISVYVPLPIFQQVSDSPARFLPRATAEQRASNTCRMSDHRYRGEQLFKLYNIRVYFYEAIGKRLFFTFSPHFIITLIVETAHGQKFLR